MMPPGQRLACKLQWIASRAGAVLNSARSILLLPSDSESYILRS